jgi:hypothetical protein
MKVKRGELFNLAGVFASVRNLSCGGKLGYAIAKNKRAIGKEWEATQKVLEFSEKYKEYDDKRIKLCEKFADKDEKGKPILKNNNFIGLENNKEFKEELDKLKEEYKEAVAEQKEKKDTYNNMLDEEIDFDLHKVKFDELPKDITAGQTEDLFLIIEDEVKKELKLLKKEK